MKKILYLSSFLLFYLLSCKNDDKEVPASENGVDAVRNFVQAALEGNYEKAKTFMVADSVNIDMMNAVERNNQRFSPEEKREYASASLRIQGVNEVIRDSITIVIYSNSYKNNKDTLRALRMNGKWLVDFKYLFNHDSDTLVKWEGNTTP